MSEIMQIRLAPPSLEVECRADGSSVLRSSDPLGNHARTVDEWILRWAKAAPERTFLAERAAGDWRRLSYRELEQKIPRLATGLLRRGLSSQTPLMILSENSIEHALLMLAAMHVGIPVAPISPAYSLLSEDHEKLRAIHALLQPGAVYASDPNRYAAALKAIGHAALDFASLDTGEVSPDVAQAHAQVTPDTVAKILFTSGSTGLPKGVINTQRMITANQQQSLQVWRFLEDEPPIVVDWLPWNHTFGGNYNFNMVLRNGGTMYIDAGKPVPALVGESLKNLREISPTMYFNVPKGFDLLLPQLEQDVDLRRSFFSRCRFFFYAGAALPQNLWERFQKVAVRETGHEACLISAWGATETAPLCLAVHFPIDRAGVVGLPVPGCEIKLMPNAGKLEARVRGPHVTPGYFQNQALSQAAFDEEGYYKIGDALKFLNPHAPDQGLVFDGRVAEDFKLRTGTWVHVGSLRTQLVSACDPLVQDAVITGHDREEIGALLFLHPQAIDLEPQALKDKIRHGLAKLSEANSHSSSMRITRALIQATPPRLDLGEITDKGYINQRMVLQLRAADVAALHASQPAKGVICLTTDRGLKRAA